MNDDHHDDTLKLELKRSGLFLEEGILLKKTRDGSIVGRHALSDVEDVELNWVVDKVGLAGCPVLAVLAFIAKYFIQSAGWGWAALVVLLGISFFSLLFIKKPQLRIASRGGEVRYDLIGDLNDFEGFAVSVKNLLPRYASGNNSLQSADRVDSESQI